MHLFNKKNWNPYLCGSLLALLQVPTYFYLKSSIGTSRAYSTFSCLLTSLYHESHEVLSSCFFHLKNWWQVGFVIGIMFGAFIAKKSEINEEPITIAPIWKKLFPEKTLIKRAVLAIFGGILFIIGANLAGGCTSGNGISGMSLLFTGSFVVIICMFIGGAITALFLPKIRN